MASECGPYGRRSFFTFPWLFPKLDLLTFAMFDSSREASSATALAVARDRQRVNVAAAVSLFHFGI